MAKRLYTLDTQGKQILEVSWKGKYKNLELKLNNTSIGIVESKKELIPGKKFEINPNMVLSVRMVQELYLFKELEILLNGLPVEGSMTHPVKRINDVFYILIFIVSINVIAGLISVLGDVPFLERVGVGFWNILYGGIFFLLGMMVKDRKSMFAMISVIVLIMLDIVSSFLFLKEYPNPANPSGPVFFKIIILLFLLRGIRAIKDFRAMEAKKEAIAKAEEEKKMKKPLSEQITENHNKFMPDDHSEYLPG